MVENQTLSVLLVWREGVHAGRAYAAQRPAWVFVLGKRAHGTARPGARAALLGLPRIDRAGR
jgi:hypothetical protein